MDFKVAGTADGITALQMDIKVGGITTEVMRKALDQARNGRLHILGKMKEALAASRQNISLFAPRIVTIRIPVDKIRDVIGPGGKMIRSIIERTGVKIDVEDDGRVNVASADGASAQKAISIIQELTATPELNKTYMGKVQRITDFGAFVEIMPGTDGLLHVSEIANHRVKDVRDELKEGEQLLVKVINIDPTGKIRLSRKALLQEEAAQRSRKNAGGLRTERQAGSSYNQPAVRFRIPHLLLALRSPARPSLTAQDQGPDRQTVQRQRAPLRVRTGAHRGQPGRSREDRAAHRRHRAQPDDRRLPDRQARRPRSAGDVRVPRRSRRHLPVLLQPARSRTAAARCAACSSSSRDNSGRSLRSTSVRWRSSPRWRSAWTWPLALHLHDAIPGDPGDNYSFVWNLWWMRHVLATPGLAYFHTTYLFYPFGTHDRRSSAHRAAGDGRRDAAEGGVAGRRAKPAAARVCLREHAQRIRAVLGHHATSARRGSRRR